MECDTDQGRQNGLEKMFTMVSGRERGMNG